MPKLTPVNDPKYAVVDGQFVNRASGEAIPEDEPVFIFRARDWHAEQIIHAYAGLCTDPQHIEIVLECARNFQDFKNDHPDRMKEPDTVRSSAASLPVQGGSDE